MALQVTALGSLGGSGWAWGQDDEAAAVHGGHRLIEEWGSLKHNLESQAIGR